MHELKLLLSGVEYKLRKLINTNKRLDEENKILNDKNKEYEQIIEEQKKIIKELEEKIKVLKIAKSLEGSSNTFEQKDKINEMLREIDKCIGLLNK
jgi:hypothetical protein